jgi:hypothetical protein
MLTESINAPGTENTINITTEVIVVNEYALIIRKFACESIIARTSSFHQAIVRFNFFFLFVI